jgi:glycosyltransferase involved in cell wall biosynthesis
VTLAVNGAPLTAEQRADLRRSRVARCFAADFALEWQQDARSFRRSCEWLRAIAARIEPDVVHVNGFAHAALEWEQPVLVVAHSCVPSWFEAVRRQQAPPEWDDYRRQAAAGLAAADLVVAPTSAMLDALRRHHRFTTEARVIANGIAAAAPGVVPGRAPRRRAVLAAGRLWDEAKNVAALARVAPLVGAPLELAGDLGSAAPKGVHALGRLGRGALRARMGETAVFCAPARYEPFGLAPLEAAAAGCALVLGDIPSLREVWGEAAMFVDPDDGSVLADALTTALDDHVALGERARLRAARYTAARMADAYGDAYERLVTERAAQPLEVRG